MDNNKPLANLDEWEMDVLKRYPDPDAIATNKATEDRNRTRHQVAL